MATPSSIELIPLQKDVIVFFFLDFQQLFHLYLSRPFLSHIHIHLSPQNDKYQKTREQLLPILQNLSVHEFLVLEHFNWGFF